MPIIHKGHNLSVWAWDLAVAFTGSASSMKIRFPRRDDPTDLTVHVGVLDHPVPEDGGVDVVVRERGGRRRGRVEAVSLQRSPDCQGSQFYSWRVPMRFSGTKSETFIPGGKSSSDTDFTKLSCFVLKTKKT